MRLAVCDRSEGAFRAVFGAGRGGGRTDARNSAAGARAAILAAVKNLVKDACASPEVRYLPLARGRVDQCLYISGACATLADVRAQFAADSHHLRPEALVDLHAPDPQHCVQVVLDSDPVSILPALIGVGDLVPQFRRSKHT